MPVFIADKAIPHVTEFFEEFGKVILIPGHEINLSSIKQASGADNELLTPDPTEIVLLVRTVTRVDAVLIEQLRPIFVGSATAGTDHIDSDVLSRAGIPFASAPGANADSVVEYVLAALFTLAAHEQSGGNDPRLSCGRLFQSPASSFVPRHFLRPARPPADTYDPA